MKTVFLVIRFFSCVLIITCFSCKDKYKKYDLVATYEDNNIKNINTIYPISYKKAIICTYINQKEQTELVSIHENTRKILWKTTLKTDTYLYYNLKYYIDKNILILPNGKELLAIDMDNGKQLWNNAFYDGAENYLEGIGDKVYRIYYSFQPTAYHILQFDVKNGNSINVFNYNADKNKKVFARTPLAVLNDHDTLLYFPVIQQNKEDNTTVPYLNIYSSSYKKIIKQDTLDFEMNSGGVAKQPLLHTDNLLLIKDNEIICFDIDRNKIKYKFQFPRDMLSSKPEIIGNTLLYPAEDGFLYAFDIIERKILWNTKISGTPSRMQIQNGKIYIIGGGNGLLYIIDVLDGKIDYSSEKNNIFYERQFLATKKHLILFGKNKIYFRKL